MTLGFLFWLIMILWALFGAFRLWPRGGAGDNYTPFGNHFVVILLFFLLGWKVFGFVIQG